MNGLLEGRKTLVSEFGFAPLFSVRNICVGNILPPMKTPATPESLLRDLAQIQRLERGSVSVLRQGPNGPYYNHQCYEEGRNVSRYVPAEQVEELKAALADHQRFQQLVQQYVQLLVERTRAERQAGSKKKSPRPTSSWPKTRKSSS
jgi:hypothetical protein